MKMLKVPIRDDAGNEGLGASGSRDTRAKRDTNVSLEEVLAITDERDRGYSTSGLIRLPFSGSRRLFAPPFAT